MNKEEFLKELDKLNLDRNSYCIIASGAMLMHDLISEVSDIDIKTSKELFDILNNKYNMKQSSRYDYVYELNDIFDVNCKNFNRDNIEFVNGYPVEKLEVNLKWMEENKRDKDKEKIRIIKEFLGR